MGHSCGKPFDEADQLEVVTAALEMLYLEQADIAAGGVVQPLKVEGWTDEDEDTNLTIGGGGMGESGEDTRQPRDGVRRYQAPEDITAELPWEAVDASVAVVSPEALRQAEIKRIRGADMWS